MTQANLESTRFLGPRGGIWRSLGATFDEDQVAGSTDAELLRDAGLDFGYETVPLTYQTPDGLLHEQSRFSAIVREPYGADQTWKEMGPVGPSYEYLQNDDLFRGVRVLMAETGWKLECMGTLGGGDQVFIVLRADTRSIFGDKLRTYIIFHDAKAKRQALSIAITPTRLYCWNQLRSGGLDIVRIPHNRAIGDEYTFWTRMLGNLERQQREVYLQLEAMARTQITDAQARTIIERAYPLPRISNRSSNLLKVSQLRDLSPQALAQVRQSLSESQANAEEARELVASRRLAAFTLYQRFNDRAEQGAQTGGAVVSDATLASLARTSYAALQAISEMVDWGGQAGAQVAAGSALFGEGSNVKARAWKACLAAAN